MKPMKRFAGAVAVAATVLLAPLAGGQDTPKKEEPKQVLFTNVRIFDGVNEKLTQGNVLVENNLIKEIGKERFFKEIGIPE